MARVELEDVAAGYERPDGSHRQVLSGLSLALKAGQLCAVLGANGSGKSTLLRVIAGLLPAAGKVLLDGEPVAGLSRQACAQRVALVPQQNAVDHGLRVHEVVLMGRAPHQGSLLRTRAQDVEIVQAALVSCELDSFADRALETLSGGEQQRVHVARALAQLGQTLLLDEATAHLDVRHAMALHRVVRRQVDARGLCCVAVMHDLAAAARLADRVLLLKEGRVVAFGSVEEVMTQERLSEAFAVAIECGRTDSGQAFFVAKSPLEH